MSFVWIQQWVALPIVAKGPMVGLPPNPWPHTMGFTVAGLARDNQHAPPPSSSPYKAREDSTPFYSALSSTSQRQHRPDPRSSTQPIPHCLSQQHEPSAFKMGSMADALPDYGSDTASPNHQASLSIPRSLSGALTYALVYQFGPSSQISAYASGNMPIHSSYGSGYAMSSGQQGFMPLPDAQTGGYHAYNPTQSRHEGVDLMQNPIQQYPQTSQYMYYWTPYPAGGQYSAGYAAQDVQGQAMFGRRASLVAAPIGIPSQSVEHSPHESSYTGARMVQGSLRGDPAANSAAFGASLYQALGMCFKNDNLIAWLISSQG